MNRATFLVLALAAVVIFPWDPAVLPGPLLRDTTPTPADLPVDGAHYTRRNVGFTCSEEICDAWLFMPKEASGKMPIVVMAHGLGVQKDFGLDEYGQKFSRAGIVAFIFDYRTFGGSEGTPRHWISPKRHLQDWASAIHFVQTNLTDKIDTEKIILGGSSFAGGHAIVTAAEFGDQVAGVIAQVPFLDGKYHFKRNLQTRGLLTMLRAIAAGAHDWVRSLTPYPAAYYPLTGTVDEFAFMQLDKDEQEAYEAMQPAQKQGGWRNMATTRFVLEASSYRPILSIPKVKVPILFIAASMDKLCPPDKVLEGSALAKKGQIMMMQCNHFQIYSGSYFDAATDAQVEFVKNVTGWLPAALKPQEQEGLQGGSR